MPPRLRGDEGDCALGWAVALFWLLYAGEFGTRLRWKHMLPGKRRSMAVTLRNKRVEEDIRAIGRETGEGPSAVIARVVRTERERLRAKRSRQEEHEIDRLLTVFAGLPKPTAKERRAVRQAMADLYDANGLPR